VSGRFSFFADFGEFELWRFTPGLFRAFPFRMEPVSASWRIRCAMECLVGYRVFYARAHAPDNRWIGYCVVSSGRNPRYPFASGRDIIFGRYFIAEPFRGRHLAKVLLRHVLDDAGLHYEKAFAYVNRKNAVSQKAISSIGARVVARFDLAGKLRRVKMSPTGEFVLFQYDGRKDVP